MLEPEIEKKSKKKDGATPVIQYFTGSRFTSSKPASTTFWVLDHPKLVETLSLKKKSLEYDISGLAPLFIFLCGDKIHEQNNVVKERYILALSLKGIHRGEGIVAANSESIVKEQEGQEVGRGDRV